MSSWTVYPRLTISVRVYEGQWVPRQNNTADTLRSKESYGVVTANDSVSANYFTRFDFSHNVGSRLFLLNSMYKYQTFTLLNNELAFDVNLSTVGCGINSALYFVPMDPDGGLARYPTNNAGAEYGTGYCDTDCTMGLKFVGGKANVEGWMPSPTDDSAGKGTRGSCCPQFTVWNSNAHSFAMSSHICPHTNTNTNGSFICEGENCGFAAHGPSSNWPRYPAGCNPWSMGCSYNPYQMGNTDFYGKGKKVDTARKFTYVIPFSQGILNVTADLERRSQRRNALDRQTSHPVLHPGRPKDRHAYSDLGGDA